jgi:phosphoglycolate phosphatase
MGLIVGFDLDMTLLDTRPGIAATYRALIEATGVPVDVELAVSRLGPPLQYELANWFPAEEIESVVTTYRALYRQHAIGPSLPLPGAAAAVAAVHAAGGTVAVITAKRGDLAQLHLDHVGIAVDELFGDVFADGKQRALRAVGATVYVGDHVADMLAAVGSGIPVTPVGVATGPCGADDLASAGARVVLGSLTELPAWLPGI